jgi:hypothetical protein
MQPVFAPAGPHQARDSTVSHPLADGVSRNVLLGVFAALAVSGWCIAAHVSGDALDASAVMALMETSGPHHNTAPPLVSHDPHFAELTPVGLELIATRTRHAGRFAQIDEYDYRNAGGDAVILLSARAPFAGDATHWNAQRAGDIRLLSWTEGGRRYVLAARAATHGFMRAADALTMPAHGAQ